MKIQEIFNQDPEYVEEILDENKQATGIFHIPIIRIKESLSKHFEKWGTSNFQIETFMWGTSCMMNCSVDLELEWKEIQKRKNEFSEGDLSFEVLMSTKFTGAYTVSVGRFQNNEDFSAIALSMCIKNAAKNIGRFFGFYLNQGHLDMETLDQIKKGDLNVKPERKSADKAVKKGVQNIINKNN